MKRCNKWVRKGNMKVSRRCLRIYKHAGTCAPDLTNIKLGHLYIKRPAPIKDGDMQWFVDYDGEERIIPARRLLDKKIDGSRPNFGYATKDGKYRSEYATVASHFHWIFNPNAKQHKYYSRMFVYKDWNPKKGGSVWKAVKWILENIGKKPDKNWSLDIIEHSKGFAPGNLRWASGFTQKQNQIHRRLGQWGEKEFAVEAHRRGYIKRTE